MGSSGSSGGLATPASKRRRGRKPSEVRALKARLRTLLALGKTEVEIMDELEVPAHDLRWLRGQLVSDELAEVVNSSPAEVWVGYRIRMEGVIADLDHIIRKSRSSTSGGVLNAAVGATKAKAQVIDNIIDRGQELGVIHREPEKVVTVNGVAISDLREGELEELVREKKKSLEDLLEKYAISDYLEEDDGDLYPAPSSKPRRRKI